MVDNNSNILPHKCIKMQEKYKVSEGKDRE